MSGKDRAEGTVSDAGKSSPASNFLETLFKHTFAYARMPPK
jgi:hypothetical protein